MQVKTGKAFAGKLALVTGGSRGIGLGIARNLAAQGCDIVFTYLRSRSDAERAEKELAACGGHVLALRANMGNQSHIQKLFQQIRKEFGRLDILIHNAATGDLKPVIELTLEQWQRSLDINLNALFLCAQQAVPLMQGRPGKIVSISSHGSRRCLANYAAIGVAKSGIEALTRYLAAELAGRGINVNAVIAGTVETESFRKFPDFKEMLNSSKAKTPMGRVALPEDIADVVSFLCSDQSRWIVGQTIVADGGYSLVP